MEGPAVSSHPARTPTWATALPLLSRPERTRISYIPLLATTTCAVLLKENRMVLINATDLDRKFGGAKWRDLQCASRLSQILPGKRPGGTIPFGWRDDSHLSCLTEVSSRPEDSPALRDYVRTQSLEGHGFSRAVIY